MAIRPEPRHYKCASCGWEKTVHPQSDALIGGIGAFRECPKCGKPVESKPAGVMTSTAAQLKDLFRK